MPDVIPFDTVQRAVRARRVEERSDDPVYATASKIRRQRVTSDLLRSGSPDAVARVTRLSRVEQIPPPLVEGREDEIERGQQIRSFAGLVSRSSAMGRWATENPRGAAAAQDDTESLGILGNAWDFLKKAPARLGGAGGWSLGGGLTDVWNTIEEAQEFILSPVDAAMGAISEASGVELLDPTAKLDTAAEAREQRSTYFRENAEAVRQSNRGGNFITEGLLQGLESVPLTIGAVLTRNPNMAAGVMGGVSSASSYAEARRRGVDTGRAIRFGLTQGIIEAGTERIPAGTLTDLIARKTPWGKAFVRELGQELTGEQVATLLQDMNEWAFLPENVNKTLADFVDERPTRAAQTALAVVGGTATTVGSIGAAQRATDVTLRISERIGQTRQARTEQQFLDRAGKAIEGAKLRTLDPEALRDLLRRQAEEAGASSVFISGEAVREFQQSDRFNADADPFAAYDVGEAAATGGDIVIPIEDALTDLVGTPAWEALREDMRLAPGGMSSREAQSFVEAMDDLMGELSDRAAQQDETDRAERSARQKLVDAIATKLGVSYTSPAARIQAEVAAQYYQARAAAFGTELTGDEFGVEIKQVMPEGVAQAVAADNLGLVINAMRKGKDAEIGEGPSLLEFIRQRGGVNDTGGDLASMGIPQRYLRDFDPRQASFGGVSGQGDFGIDTTLRAAIEAGYFPELNELENEAGASTLDTQVLLDALAEEAAGRPRFASVREDATRRAAEDLRAMLDHAGLNPDEMSDAEVRAAVKSMAAEATEGALRQSDMSNAPQGQINFEDGKVTIELFQSRNLSTFFHEFGHLTLENLRADAALPNAPERLKGGWETAKRWFAASGHPVGTGGAIPVEAHELWARGFERYLMEGKAPSPSLARLFETISRWFKRIYRTVDELRAPITPEIREVFDRLLATDEELAAAQERQGLAALFKDAASIGMTEPQFQAYQRQVDDARAGAHSALLDKTMATIRRREQERYSEAHKRIKAEETERIDGSPVFKALALMKEQRVSREWIGDEMGIDALDLLPVRVPPLHTPGGVHPDIIAELSGYRSGREMVEAIIGAEIAHRKAKEGGDTRSMRQRAIEEATNAEFARRYGDPLNDGSIEREATAAVHNEMQGEVIASELRILSRKTGRRPTPYALAKEWARGKIRAGTVALEASPSAIQRYARNAAKAGREAEKAMLAQDVDEAFRQKQFQMMNNALVAEAKAAHDEVTAAVRRLDKIARAKTRKSVDQDYLEQAHALLEAVDLRERTQKSLALKDRFMAWAQARQAEGFDIVVPDNFEGALQTHWSRLTVENLLALDEAVKQIIHLGRLKQTLIDDEKQRAWDEIYSEAEGNADNIGRKPPKGSFADPGWWDSIKSGVATMDAALLKMEQVFDWLDQGNIGGVFNRIVFRPIAAAQAREQDMTRDYFARIHDAMGALPKEVVRRWGDKITLDLIDPATGLPAVFERKKLISAALNWGNAGNRQRLADGYGWSPQGVEAALMDNLSEAEWQFVQQVWDIIDTLWPEIEKMERAINGVAPERVEAVDVVTPFGTLRGGYYPAIYDSTLDYAAEEQAGRKSDLFEAKYTRATTRASATKDRMAKVSRPILLDIGVINRHLGEVIHDVTHREAVMQAHKFLTSRRVMKAVDETLGPEIRQQFRPWLQHVANSWAQDRAGSEGLGKFFSKARANATVVGMGWRFTTMLTQIAGYSNSFEMVGAKWVSAAVAQASVHPIDSFNFVMERSGEMRGRMDTIDRDIRAEMTRMGSKVGAAADRLADAKRFAFHGIGYMDRVVSIPTWLGAYNKAISEGFSEEEAAYAGDKAIRLSQGAAGPKDLAAVATGQGRFGEAFKWLTMFYSYLSTVYSRQRNLGRDARRAGAKDLPGLMARAWWLIVVPPLLAEILSGRGPDDDEDPAWWAFKRMLSQSVGAIPGVRDVAEPVFAGLTGDFSFGYRLSPVQAAGESVVRVAKDTGRIARGEDTNRATRDVMEMTGYFTGLVPGQLAASTQFLVDVGYGEADPETLSDWYTGLTKGRISAD